MPCYDPPPEWEGDAKRSAEEAAIFLCTMVGILLDKGRPVALPFLLWYLEHRRIDLRIADDGRMGKQSDRAAIEADIARVERLLSPPTSGSRGAEGGGNG